MTYRASCLCGAVRFEFETVVGPFEICHCNRCRKLSGAQGMPALSISAEGYRIVKGEEMIQTYEAPILYQAPAYHSYFCRQCGSPLPPPKVDSDWLEIPAGLLDDDPGYKPDKHIFTEFLPGWDQIQDDLPQYDMAKLYRSRRGEELPETFQLKSHYDSDD